MKKFLAVYTGSAAAMASWNALTETERQQMQVQGMAAWKKWVADNAASIVDVGGPLSKSTLINKAGISDIRNNLGAFTIVQAESQAAVAKLFVNHPHFTFFPGEGVEVMEVMQIPG